MLAKAAFLGLLIILLFDFTAVGGKIDSYRGVAVYYNGSDFEANHGKNYSEDGYYFGQKWQCVEYVKRFYYLAKNHSMPDTMGNARDFFDPALKQGQFNSHRGLVQYKNGGDMKPSPDDLLVFTDTQYGHVAIITKVTDTFVEIIQQNMGRKSRQRLPLSFAYGRYTVGDRWFPAGWLRKELK